MKRTKKPPLGLVASERQIQQAVIEYLTLMERRFRCYFVRVGSGAIKTDDGRYFKSGKRGCPDVLLCLGGRFYGLEIKTATGGRQSDPQKDAQQMIEHNGGKYLVVRSAEEVMELFTSEKR